MSNRLGGKQGTAYLGTNANNPPNVTYNDRDPNQYDNQNYSVGDEWINTVAKKIWKLLSLEGDESSKGALADWVQFGLGDIQTLTSNSGGAVGPDGSNNINIVGDATSITGVGNPGTNTITLSVIATLTGNSGGPVSLSAGGNWNIVGSGPVSVVGNPGTNTLTISDSGVFASSYPTDSGTAVPAANVLNVFGGTSARDINTSGSGHTIHIDLDNAITLGDLAVLGAGVGAVTATTGDVIVSAGNIQMPATNTAGTQGVILLGGQRFAYANASGENTFLGISAGNSGTTPLGARNAGLGFITLTNLTTGFDNSAVGSDSSGAVTTGTQNSTFGSQSGGSMTTGSNNTLIGFQTGNMYSGAESSNIALGSLITATVGESNTCRIGAGTGTGDGLVNKTFIGGIRGITTTNNNAIAVLIDSAGQLGTVSL